MPFQEIGAGITQPNSAILASTMNLYFERFYASAWPGYNTRWLIHMLLEKELVYGVL